VGKVLARLGWEGDAGVTGLDGGNVGERGGLERKEIRDAAGREGEGGEGDEGRREWVVGVHERWWEVVGGCRERLRGCSYDGGRVNLILDELCGKERVENGKFETEDRETELI